MATLNDKQKSTIPPIIGFAAPSGTGKTQLLETLISLLRKKNLKIALIKHAHHNFDVDTPGKDSYRLRKAGAMQTLVASSKRWALMTEETNPRKEPDLSELIPNLDLAKLDLIIFEGFKHSNYPKIVLHRKATGKSVLEDDEHVIAYATDNPIDIESNKTLLDLNNPDEILQFIQQLLKMN